MLESVCFINSHPYNYGLPCCFVANVIKDNIEAIVDACQNAIDQTATVWEIVDYVKKSGMVYECFGNVPLQQWVTNPFIIIDDNINCLHVQMY